MRCQGICRRRKGWEQSSGTKGMIVCDALHLHQSKEPLCKTPLLQRNFIFSWMIESEPSQKQESWQEQNDSWAIGAERVRCGVRTHLQGRVKKMSPSQVSKIRRCCGTSFVCFERAHSKSSTPEDGRPQLTELNIVQNNKLR